MEESHNNTENDNKQDQNGHNFSESNLKESEASGQKPNKQRGKGGKVPKDPKGQKNDPKKTKKQGKQTKKGNKKNQDDEDNEDEQEESKEIKPSKGKGKKLLKEIQDEIPEEILLEAQGGSRQRNTRGKKQTKVIDISDEDLDIISKLEEQSDFEEEESKPKTNKKSKDKDDNKESTKKKSTTKKDKKQKVASNDDFDLNLESQDKSDDEPTPDDEYQTGESGKPQKGNKKGGKGKEKDDPKAKKADKSKATRAKSAPQKGGDKKAAAPKKKLTEKQEKQLILDYMIKQNRPYSSVVLEMNLHKQIGKKQLDKLLDQLSNENELTCKEFGKAKIYLYNQKNIKEVNKQDLEDLSIALTKKRQEEKDYLTEIKRLNTTLASLNSQLTNKQIELEIKRYIELNQNADKKLQQYQSGDYEKISDEQMKKVEDAHSKMEKMYKKRKRQCIDLIKDMQEKMEKKSSEIYELLGIDEESV